MGVEEDDRLISQGGKARIDMGDDVRNATLQLVFFRCLQSYLDENDLETKFVIGYLVDTAKLTFPRYSGYLVRKCSNATILWRTP